MTSSFGGCKKDPPVNPPLPDFSAHQHNVLILNEGNFMWGNASLTHINPDNHEVTHDVFSRTNARPLGDVAQSAIIVGEEIWVIVNNSQKIERINRRNYKSIGSISSLQSPRYACFISMHKMYVTDLYANKIHILNPTNGTKSGEILCHGWNEELLYSNGHVYLCNVKNNQLLQINASTNQIIDSISVGDAPRSIQKDSHGRIWVLCEGNIPPQETAGSLYCIDANSHQVLKQFQFPNAQIHPSALCLSNTKNELLFLYNGIFKMNIDSDVLPVSAYIPQGNRLFYSLSVQPQTGDIWVGDAGDYVQRGIVFRYSDASKELIHSYETGIIPGKIYFD